MEKNDDIKEEIKEDIEEIKEDIEEKSVEVKKAMSKIVKINKKNTWKIATFVLAGLFIISLFTNGFSFDGTSGTADIGEKDIETKIDDFIQNNLVGSGVEAEITDISEEYGLYKFDIVVNSQGQTQETESYATKDGNIFFIQGVKLDDVEDIEDTTTTTTIPQELPKTEKPIVDVFIMSHCPYGTQIEKGILPVFELLGDKIDSKIRFVYYAMHGEVEVNEQMNQYCIQEEQNDKFIDYLSCFLEDGDSERCLDAISIDTTKLEKCVAEVDKEFGVTEALEDQSSWLSGRYPLFNVDKELNDKYSVGGSPTLIINGVQSRAGRDSASLLSAICGAFEEEPAECGEIVSTSAPSPGFGFSESGSTAAGSCS